MEQIFEIENNKLKVSKEVETKQEVNLYSLDFLRKQEADIIKQRDDFVSLREIELAEVRLFIVEAEKGGLTVEPVIEPVEEVIEPGEDIMPEEEVIN
jgi:hypothetical protein